MITDVLLDFVFGFVKLVLTPVKITNLNIPTSFLEKFGEVMSMVAYFIPIGPLMPLFVVFVTLMSFRIIIRLIKTIWDLLPVL